MTEYCEICGEELETEEEISIGVCNYCSLILADTEFGLSAGEEDIDDMV